MDTVQWIITGVSTVGSITLGLLLWWQTRKAERAETENRHLLYQVQALDITNDRMEEMLTKKELIIRGLEKKIIDADPGAALDGIFGVRKNKDPDPDGNGSN